MRARLFPARAALLAFMATGAALLASCVFDLAPLEESSDAGTDAGDEHAAHDAHADHHDAAHDAPDDGDASDDHVDANPCGNGVLDPGEACDDDGSFCVDCQVPCDQPYEFRNNTTHHCYGAFQQGMTYGDAETYCEAQHATLAIIKGSAELMFVEAGIDSVTGVTWNQRVWIGAKKSGSDWFWEDGTKLPLSDSNWLHNEPDHKYMGVSGAGCVSLDRVGQGFDDAACTSIHDFVCEYVPPPPVPDGGTDAGDGG